MRPRSGDPLRKVGPDAAPRLPVPESRPSPGPVVDFFELAPIAIVTTDSRGRFLRTNGAAQVMFGYTDPEFRTKTFQELTHPDDVAASMVLNREPVGHSDTAFSNSYGP